MGRDGDGREKAAATVQEEKHQWRPDGWQQSPTMSGSRGSGEAAERVGLCMGKQRKGRLQMYSSLLLFVC